MDLGLLPDVVLHFQTAAHHVAPFANNLMESGINLWVGLTNSEAMGIGPRGITTMKIAAATFGLITSIATRNYEAALGCAIAEGEAIMELTRAGSQYRALQMNGG